MAKTTKTSKPKYKIEKVTAYRAISTDGKIQANGKTEAEAKRLMEWMLSNNILS